MDLFFRSPLAHLLDDPLDTRDRRKLNISNSVTHTSNSVDPAKPDMSVCVFCVYCVLLRHSVIHVADSGLRNTDICVMFRMHKSCCLLAANNDEHPFHFAISV